GALATAAATAPAATAATPALAVLPLARCAGGRPLLRGLAVDRGGLRARGGRGLTPRLRRTPAILPGRLLLLLPRPLRLAVLRPLLAATAAPPATLLLPNRQRRRREPLELLLRFLLGQQLLLRG